MFILWAQKSLKKFSNRQKPLSYGECIKCGGKYHEQFLAKHEEAKKKEDNKIRAKANRDKNSNFKHYMRQGEIISAVMVCFLNTILDTLHHQYLYTKYGYWWVGKPFL